MTITEDGTCLKCSVLSGLMAVASNAFWLSLLLVPYSLQLLYNIPSRSIHAYHPQSVDPHYRSHLPISLINDEIDGLVI